MKFLLFLAVLMIGVWLWRTGRRDSVSRDAPRPPQASTDPQEMVSCQLCSLHIPRAEAVSGKLGLYCCKDHLLRVEP